MSKRQAQGFWLVLAIWLSIQVILAGQPPGSSSGLWVEPQAADAAVELRLKGNVTGGQPLEVRLQRSADLKQWGSFGSKVRLPAGHGADGIKLGEDDDNAGFFRLLTRETAFTATTGADVLGYSSAFEDEIEALGSFSIENFAARHSPAPAYLPGITWNPTNSLYWDAFQRDVVKKNSWGWAIHFEALRFTPEELAVFQTNGFVVSERLGSHSFAETYYQLFVRDLPVFITTDSILHAWHRSFDAVLQQVESQGLKPNLESLLRAMLGQVEVATSTYGSGVLQPSLQDADFLLRVPLSIAFGPGNLRLMGIKDPLNQQDRASSAVSLITAQQPKLYSFFDGKQDSEIVDFSLFTPRGHYTKNGESQAYFQEMIWLGTVDLRVAGNTNYASLRQLGTAIVLNDLLNRSGQRSLWRKLNDFITRFIGPPDSLNFDQLDALLQSAGITNAAQITSLDQLEVIRDRIEKGTLGVQAIQGHGFLGSAGEDQIQLPRSFTFLGQRFTADSWAFNQVVFDRIEEPGSEPPRLVRRRLPYALDVAYSVFANDQVVPDLVANMRNPSGIPFRDGFGYQRNLVAVRNVLDQRPASAWTDNLYNHWLFALRTLSEPTTAPIYPEAMRTHAWAMKTLNTQLASWTQLRHDTTLYAKQSVTPPILCEYPYGYVEPRPAFFAALKSMARFAANNLDSLRDLVGPPPYPLSLNMPAAIDFFIRFGNTCETLETIAKKHLNQQPLAESEVNFLRNTIEKVDTYYGERQYNGWFPELFYWGKNGDGLPFPGSGPFGTGSGKGADHDSDLPDYLVADVHTDGPSEPDGDPGAVLHEAVGKINLLLIAVDNGPDRMVFAGPVMSHYEFTKPYGTRLTDELWRQQIEAGNLPEPPPWTRSYWVRKP